MERGRDNCVCRRVEKGRGGGEGGRMRRHVDTKNERKSLIFMTLKSK